MKDAMRSFLFDPASQIRKVGKHSDVVLRGTHLRDALLDKFPEYHDAAQKEREGISHFEHGEDGLKKGLPRSGAFVNDTRLQSWCARYSRPDPVALDGDPPLDHLNAVQKQAIAMMLSQRLSLVQGPPGTGKTKVIVEAIRILKVTLAISSI